jgi:hypothetical protein
VHWFAYAMWPVALAHGIGSGSDRSTIWMLAIDAVCLLAVIAVLTTTHPAVAGTEPTVRPVMAQRRRSSV